MSVEKSGWTDPRTNPAPPFRGPKRPLASDSSEIAELMAACKQGRFYDVEEWIACGKPLQALPGAAQRRRSSSPLLFAVSAGQLDLVRVLLCNGYRAEFEPRSPIDDALDSRRWDILGLLLDWGVDPKQADVWRILDTYDRATLERFWTLGIDLTEHDAMADALGRSTSNRPLYGFAKNYRERDPRIQRALDVGLGVAVAEQSDKAVSLCLWAGGAPRSRVGDVDDSPEEDAWGMTAIERAVSHGFTQYLKKLGFDAEHDELESLYDHVHDASTLGTLVALKPPNKWQEITQRFIERLAMSERLELRWTSVRDVEAVFRLGGYLDRLDSDAKRNLRKLLLDLGDYDAKHLFRLLRDPQNMRPEVFINLVAHEKMMARYSKWSRRSGVSKDHLAEFLKAPRVPAPVRRWARLELTPHRHAASHTRLTALDGPLRTYSREELYDLVWSEPLTILSSRFGLSDNGLRKRCKAMAIPTPPRGYWEKVHHGLEVEKAPLPAIAED